MNALPLSFLTFVGSSLLALVSCNEMAVNELRNLDLNIPDNLVLSGMLNEHDDSFDEDRVYIISLDSELINNSDSEIKYLDNRNYHQSRLIEIVPLSYYSVEYENEIDPELYDVFTEYTGGSVYGSSSLGDLHRKYDLDGRRVASCYTDSASNFEIQCLSTVYYDKFVVEFRTVGLKVDNLDGVVSEVRGVLSNWMI